MHEKSYAEFSIIPVLNTLLKAYNKTLESKGKVKDYESEFIHNVTFNTKVNCDSLKNIFYALFHFYEKKAIPDSQIQDLTTLAILRKAQPVSIIKSVFRCCSRHKSKLRYHEEFTKNLGTILKELGIALPKKLVKIDENSSFNDLVSDSIPTPDSRYALWKSIIEDEDHPASVVTKNEIQQLGGL